jgi:hypothetical protein
VDASPFEVVESAAFVEREHVLQGSDAVVGVGVL